MKPGKPPQPAELVKQKGYYRKGRHGDEIAETGVLGYVYQLVQEPPKHLPQVAAKLWATQLNEAQKIYGYIGFIDLVLFERYCMTYYFVVMFQNKIIAFEKKDEEPSKSDWVEYHKLEDRFHKLSREFGFSPSSRTGVKLEQLKEEKKKKVFKI